MDTNQHAVCDNIDLDTILIEYENYYYLRYQKKPKISKSLDVAKTDIHAIKSKTKSIKKKNSNSSSQDTNPLDTSSFITVSPLSSLCDENLEHEYSLPSVDLSLWKDEWQEYAEIISKVLTKKSFRSHE